MKQKTGEEKNRKTEKRKDEKREEEGEERRGRKREIGKRERSRIGGIERGVGGNGDIGWRLANNARKQCGVPSTVDSRVRRSTGIGRERKRRSCSSSSAQPLAVEYFVRRYGSGR